MGNSGGKYYYIISGFVDRGMSMRNVRLVTEEDMHNGQIAIKVRIPDDTPVIQCHDERYNITYYECRRSARLDEFDPKILVLTYFGWKELFTWEDVSETTFYKKLISMGYTYNPAAGFMNEEAQERYNKSNKLLFG